MGNAEEVYEKKKCRHCNVRVGRQRGLCGRCYDDRSVRSLYPVLVSKRELHGLASKGYGLEMAKDLRGWEPTEYLPGTEEKIRVLERRASKGLPLWHPHDAKKDLLRNPVVVVEVERVIRLSCDEVKD